MDQACVELVRKLIKVGYVEIHDLNQRALGNLSGVPQGSILSPLLCNIYFNSFDQFVVNTLVPLYTSGTLRAENLEYKRSR
jgi:retron-type reverse transcriptase